MGVRKMHLVKKSIAFSAIVVTIKLVAISMNVITFLI